MARQRLDPGYPDAVVMSTKLGQADAERVTELARQAGVRKSEFVRAALLRELEREDAGAGDRGG